MCGNVTPVQISAAQGGGTWSGWGGTFITDNDSTITFDPSLVTAGTDIIYYRITEQCGDTSQISITVDVTDVAVIDGAGPFCQTDSPTDLSISATSTTGGVWSGPHQSAGAG